MGQARKDQTNEIKTGGRVEMFDGSHQGTITEVQGPYCLLITWDDGQTGHVHPDDVKHLPEPQGFMERESFNMKHSAEVED